MASKLIIQIIADIKEHLKGLSEAQKATDKFAKSAEQAGGPSAAV